MLGEERGGRGEGRKRRGEGRGGGEGGNILATVFFYVTYACVTLAK